MTSGPIYSSEAASAIAVRQLTHTAAFLLSPSLSTKSLRQTSQEVLQGKEVEARRFNTLLYLKMRLRYRDATMYLVKFVFHGINNTA